MKVAVIVVAVIAVLVCALVLLRQGHPEQTSTHTDDPTSDTLSDRLYRGVDRPAGPDVEDQSIGDPTVGGTSQPGAAEGAPDPPRRMMRGGGRPSQAEKRTSRPGRAPVASPPTKVTSPATTVAS